MSAVTFRAKVERLEYVDGTLSCERIKVPELKRSHCDMNAMRCSAKYGAYANSDLFQSILRRAVAAAGVGAYIKLNDIPAAVTVDTSGFLAKVTIEI